MAPSEFLKIIKEGFERLAETAPQIPDSVISLYKIRFGNDHELSKPTIANGIDKIEVYSQAIEIASRRESVIIAPIEIPIENTIEKPKKKPTWK
jgi:hypothetical protein